MPTKPLYKKELSYMYVLYMYVIKSIIFIYLNVLGIDTVIYSMRMYYKRKKEGLFPPYSARGETTKQLGEEVYPKVRQSILEW